MQRPTEIGPLECAFIVCVVLCARIIVCWNGVWEGRCGWEVVVEWEVDGVVWELGVTVSARFKTLRMKRGNWSKTLSEKGDTRMAICDCPSAESVHSQMAINSHHLRCRESLNNALLRRRR